MRICKAIVAFICLCTPLIGVLGSPPRKIVGGTYSSPDEFPYQVSIRMNGYHICGGSIISTRHILTAAHCLYNYINMYKQITVVSGTTYLYLGGQSHSIQTFRIHPAFINNANFQFANDIAVITVSEPNKLLFSEFFIKGLETPIKIDHSQHIIKLASQSDYGGFYGVVSGWGKTSYSEEKTFPYLLKLVTNVINATYCQEILSRQLYSSQVCALAFSASGTCQGDSGGPLAVGNELVGIVSFGFKCGAGFPDVYTSIYAYRTFIEEVIRESGFSNEILYPKTYDNSNIARKIVTKVQHPTTLSDNVTISHNKIYYLFKNGQWFQVQHQ
ncbi:trypsin beta-like [Leptopilina heterotoma]|uniref:trypsin beta-like n=1 Tax=Leptopilina heterotoma TaxID=63436 RepID=UPI001CA99E58|nr:trypsin beta-like [Leptopilina heterotoma]